MLQCSQCTKEFKYESERKRHEQSHFPQFECQECSKKFSFLSALRRHQKQHSRTGSVLCKDCGRSFKDNSLLLRHIKYAHEGSFSCSKCDAKFSSESALSMHQKTHKPKSERRFHCSHEGCDKSFNFVHHLKHHQLTHNDIKQYHCDVCGKGFIQAHHYKSHLKTHEPENWLRCNILNCKKSFATDYAFRRHLLTHSKVTDSGISSDSSSDVHSYSSKDEVLCASCGQITSNTSHGKHECTPSYPKEELAIYLKNDSDSDLNQIVLEKFTNTEELSDLKFELRNMYSGVEDNEGVRPFIEGNSTKVSESTESTKADSGGCRCNYKCKGAPEKPDTNCIEYRSDGTIKIKDTIDLDFIVEAKPKDVAEKNDFQNVPFNSCKDILGKCIVSGNGTISEECLCAKMAMNDQEMIEQEMAEITPQPAMQF
ncbi:zinc finger and SCAN domain-containing protein 2-like [Aricia agestis]|uniref:zinc finger and SCAN domain-containing protein 2-like n=1 Tax=Aricia agestis TaxID=91739 RepID=UPI001C205034|nr:zinc finger and SCAN domain-containing protein 2-like [Aricia agestis]